MITRVVKVVYRLNQGWNRSHLYTILIDPSKVRAIFTRKKFATLTGGCVLDRLIGSMYFQDHTCGAGMSAVPDMSGFIFRFAVFFNVNVDEQ